jgi:hypothetical protein
MSHTMTDTKVYESLSHSFEVHADGLPRPEAKWYLIDYASKPNKSNIIPIGSRTAKPSNLMSVLLSHLRKSYTSWNSPRSSWKTLAFINAQSATVSAKSLKRPTLEPSASTSSASQLSTATLNRWLSTRTKMARSPLCWCLILYQKSSGKIFNCIISNFPSN